MATQTTGINHRLLANQQEFASPLGKYARDRESQKTNMVGGKQMSIEIGLVVMYVIGFVLGFSVYHVVRFGVKEWRGLNE
ncbi:hypothetical protein [Carnobacterium maltaromaticum]|uniref:hypothetical protein n=1 Tax=Carnobacterium maltaromaticum TaxID=2751 RepID=UPI00165A8347|nr:hypothetical protein [Carnobacterium maltaromaticum]MBC9808717.1 hypothetical protein [Carnobacterium maltaromaticum]